MTMTRAEFLRAAVLGVTASLVLPFGVASAAPSEAPGDPRYFTETGYRISDDAMWDYFQKRGGIRTFGYPVSRKFQFMGSQVQFFQRRILQIQPNGSVGQINLLDNAIMPYTTINGATFPAPDDNLIKTIPPTSSPSYAVDILNFVKANAPESFAGMPTKFYSTYINSVTMGEAYPNGGGNVGLMQGIALEMWGAPISAPALDPNNHNFVYQRFQRGIMHYDNSNGVTQGLLLADYFKAIITGQNLPADLDNQAKSSPYYKQYNNAAPYGLNRPDQMPNSNLQNAFEHDTPQAGAAPVTNPTTTTGLRYGMQADYSNTDKPRAFSMIQAAGFSWSKQQIRWGDLEESQGNISWGLMDSLLDAAAASGTNMLFSVVTAPAWSRGDHSKNGPPDNLANFGNFLGAVAGRYRGRVKAYEIWNEQNFSREWGGGRINAGAYVEMLKVAYRAIKAADPNAIVLSGALTPTGVNDPNVAVDDALFLDQMYAYQGGVIKTVCDGIGAHMCGYNNAPDDWMDKNTAGTSGYKGHPSFYFRRIDDLHNIMAKYGDSHQMWLTEYEWASATAPVPAGYEWTTALSEQTVANYLSSSIQSIKASRPWVGALFIWNLNWRTFSDPHSNESALFGILNADWTPRAMYNALKAMPK